METTEKIKVVIKRNRWRTGNFHPASTGAGPTKLLNKEGYMCCLGFCCKAAGALDKDIEGLTAPACAVLCSKVYRNFHQSTEYIKHLYDLVTPSDDNSQLALNAIDINDSDLPRKEKESRLLELFKDTNFEISFDGKYEDE